MDTEFPKTAVEYIHSLGRFSGRPGLHRIRALCKALGDPQDRLRFVHLAGTNGKGSTATMIASALQAAGLRTGLYTSPYLVQFYERIRIDGSMISSDDLAHLSERVAVACESLTLPEGETIGEFEFTTAVAFLYFVEQGCDIVVLETGLGGRCDATNVIRSPEVCAITPISLDHMAVLGDTVAEIAGEKAGIIKSGADVVCANGQEEAALAVLRHVTASQGAVWHESADTLRVLRCDLNGSAFICDGQGYTIAMPGRHRLPERLYGAPHSGCAASARLGYPGRGRRARSGTRAHRRKTGAPWWTHLSCCSTVRTNAAGIDALCGAVHDLLKMRRLHVVMGMVCDKEYEYCVHRMARQADAFYACTTNAAERSLGEQTIASLAEQECGEVYDCRSTEHALELALDHASPTDCILVCGSLLSDRARLRRSCAADRKRQIKTE